MVVNSSLSLSQSGWVVEVLGFRPQEKGHLAQSLIIMAAMSASEKQDSSTPRPADRSWAEATFWDGNSWRQSSVYFCFFSSSQQSVNVIPQIWLAVWSDIEN